MFSPPKWELPLAISSKLATFKKRFPKRFSDSIFVEAKRLCTIFPSDFFILRPKNHLFKLTLIFHTFVSRLHNKSSFYHKNKTVFTKLISTHLLLPLGKKRVLALVIVMPLNLDVERFSKKHIAKALERICPPLRIYKNSYCSYIESTDGICRIYVELEHREGKGLCLQERKTLCHRLPRELKRYIQTLSPSCVSLKDEEAFSNQLKMLKEELSKGASLPQVSISFNSQTYSSLKFAISCVRAVSSTDSTLRKLLKHIDANFRVLFEMEAILGSLPSLRMAEGAVFFVEVSNASFLRIDQSVDIVRAREVVCSALKEIIGPFRDFNGGACCKNKRSNFLSFNRLSKKKTPFI